jgi:hydroxyethylthiazole kinase-like uncharacterized protein yjeF
MADLPEGALMQRAAFGLAVHIARVLQEHVGRVSGSRVVALVGPGNNGGDALFACAELARRGASVAAIAVAESVHTDGVAALHRAGGRVFAMADAAVLLRGADVVVDGIIGIGGRGAVRPPARDLLGLLGECPVVAVDVPSGIDADTGAVAIASIAADLTVTFGCYKPGLLLAPGRERCGEVTVVDIGLTKALDGVSSFVFEREDVVRWVPLPGLGEYKYSRGVACLRVGSVQYPGAGLLSVGAARAADIGMVVVIPPAPDDVHAVYPDVVVAESSARVTAICVGPGIGRGDDAAAAVASVMHADVPIILDADALHVVSIDALRERGARGGVTVLTPHEGEFRALGFDGGVDRRAAACAAAGDLRSVVVLKGPGTVVASPTGESYLDARTTPALGTAGSGDVLAGLLTGLLAGAHSRGEVPDVSAAAECAAAAVWLHSAAGRGAQALGAVHAPDLVAALGGVIHAVRITGGVIVDA